MIQYDQNQTPEKTSGQIYNELLALPTEIRKGLQELLLRAPIIKLGYLVENKRNHDSRVMDLSDLQDIED